MPCNRPISGKPDAAAPHVRFDEGGGGPPAPPLLDCFRDSHRAQSLQLSGRPSIKLSSFRANLRPEELGKRFAYHAR